MSKGTVVVGLSGGVDSSVAALLLKQAGYQVQGLFMKNWEEDFGDCPSLQDAQDAQTVCKHLNIPFEVVNFSKDYQERVFADFLKEYEAGRTPNPDILCNKEIKFKVFLNYALELGADWIATGHYAANPYENNHYTLRNCHDTQKDQTYFLYTLNQTQLAKTLFPLSHLTKSEVRNLAAEAGFLNHKKKDSTGICFIGERPFRAFLQIYLAKSPGNIYNAAGEFMGKHEGLMYYTLGQRQGLGIGGKKDSSGQPWYLAKKNKEDNSLIVVQGKNNPLLYHSALTCDALHWIKEEPPLFPLHCTAKIRYRQQPAACVVTPLSFTHLSVKFSDSQWAITPGQSIVFYDQDICLGGGIINDF